jgi:hypothetical protein
MQGRESNREKTSDTVDAVRLRSTTQTIIMSV